MILRRVTPCLLMLAAALPGFGQMRSSSPRASYTIAGSVRDDYGHQTLENVRVDLKSPTGVSVSTTFTRGNGEFEFGPLNNGDYVIEVEMKDYEPFRQRVTLTNNSQRGVSIFLTRPAAAAAETSGASVSAHELSVPRKAHDEYEKGLQLLYTKSDYRGAIVQFQRAIKDFATFYEAYAQEASAYLQLKETASAEQAMHKSVELSSGQYSYALFMISAFCNDTDRYTDAETFAKQAIEVDAGSWRGPFELARALLGLKQAEPAEKSAIEARDMKPDNASTYLILANIHIKLQNYPALMKDLDSFLKLAPSGPAADQARKTRDDLQSATPQTENQNQATGRQTPPANPMPRETPSPAAEQSTPPPEPDSSGLPSLAPPIADN